MPSRGSGAVRVPGVLLRLRLKRRWPSGRLDEHRVIGHGLDAVADPSAPERLVNLREPRAELFDAAPLEYKVVGADDELQVGVAAQPIGDLEGGDTVGREEQVDVRVQGGPRTNLPAWGR